MRSRTCGDEGIVPMDMDKIVENEGIMPMDVDKIVENEGVVYVDGAVTRGKDLPVQRCWHTALS